MTIKLTGNSTHGYFGGGVDDFPTTAMDKITYSTDTIAAVPGARLSARRNEIGSTGNLDSGYFTGGYTPSNSSTTTISEKVTYSTDTISTAPSAGLTVARNELSASSPIANAVPTTSSSCIYTISFYFWFTSYQSQRRILWWGN